MQLPIGLAEIKNMKFSIITPSFKQLDWLRLCLASVRDQVAAADCRMLDENQIIPSPLVVEHIIQDAGSPGIDEFARQVGADFYRDGHLVFQGKTGNDESGMTNGKLSDSLEYSKFRIQNPDSCYRISIHCERDSGMYDAINCGLARCTGDICAWLNCDEQYLTGTLEKVMHYFHDKPSLDVLLGDAVLVDADLKPLCYRRIMIPNRWHTRLEHLHSLSCAMFFKPSALPNPPLDPKWKVISDGVLVDYFLGKKKTIISCRELLSAYAFTGANLSYDRPVDELQRWREEVACPPIAFRPFVILHNRIRRMWHGAYRTFPVNAAIYTHRAPDQRQLMIRNVSGVWPT